MRTFSVLYGSFKGFTRNQHLERSLLGAKKHNRLKDCNRTGNSTGKQLNINIVVDNIPVNISSANSICRNVFTTSNGVVTKEANCNQNQIYFITYINRVQIFPPPPPYTYKSSQLKVPLPSRLYLMYYRFCVK